MTVQNMNHKTFQGYENFHEGGFKAETLLQGQSVKILKAHFPDLIICLGETWKEVQREGLMVVVSGCIRLVSAV